MDRDHAVARPHAILSDPPPAMTLSEKLRGHAAAVRSGAIGPGDSDWFSASLDRLAREAEGAEATRRAARDLLSDAVPEPNGAIPAKLWPRLDALRAALAKGYPQ